MSSNKAHNDTTNFQPLSEHKNAAAANLFSLAGKTIAITGGGRGVGITLAGAVLAANGHAACIDLLPEPSAGEWADLRTLAEKSSLQIQYYRCDITDEDALSTTIDSIAEAARARGAPLAGAVAFAGIQHTAPTIDYPASGLRRILDVNVTGTFLTTKHCARHFMAQKSPGSIVLIASMSGQIANRVKCSLSSEFI
jgi:NAD(P)-dependent dehydrogenase (short-subunit alcohol dehydrogenase family)